MALHTVLECVISNYRAACDAAREGMEVAEALGDGYQFMICQTWGHWALHHLGDWGKMRRGLEAALRTAERNASPVARAEFHRRQGQTGEAEGYRCRGAEVIDALAASLEETDPLRQSLLNHPLRS